MSEIGTLSLERLNNGAHFLFISNVLARAEADANVKSKLSAQIVSLKAAKEQEDEDLKVSQKSMLTDDIATADDLALSIDALAWFCIAPIGLDLTQSVEGGHERHIELMFQAVSSHSRQPVIGMDQPNRALDELLTNTFGEFVDDRGQFLLRKIHRSSIDVNHLEARLNVHHPLEFIVVSPNINRC